VNAAAGLRAWAVTVALTGLFGVAARTAGPSEALASMADAERAFARASAARGMRAAFLEFLDDDAIGFRPTLGRAKDQWASRPEPAHPLATTLAWDPRTGEVSADGRLGWLAGPYLLVPEGDASKTIYGCYSSIWRREAGGSWRVYIDLGVSTPVPCEFPAAFEAVAGGPAPGVTGTREALLAADRALAAASHGSGFAAAFGAAADVQVRVHREGRQPAVGREAAVASLSAEPSPPSFDTVEGGVAGSGDVGFTYGRAQRAGGSTANGGYYVRTWRVGPGGAWRVVFDVLAW